MFEFDAATPRNVRLLYLHNFLNDFRFQQAFLVIYFNQITGSYAASMGILALEMLVSALLDIPTGIFSDKMGRKYTLTLGSLCYAVAVSCYAAASSLWGLVPGAMLFGLGRCLFNGNNTALLYESLKEVNLEGQFAHYQGRALGMFQLALGLSALCGGVLVEHGMRLIFWLGVIPQILSIGVSLLLREPPQHVGPKHQGFEHFKKACVFVWKNKRLRLLIVGQAISYGAGESTFSFKSAFVNILWPTWAVGFYRALNHGLGFIGFWFAGKWVAHVKAPQMLALTEGICFVLDALAVGFANVVSPLLMLAGALLYGPFMVARDQLLQNEFTDTQRATLGSVASFSGSIFYAGVALCLGVISDHFGLAAGIGFGVGVCLLALPLYVWLFRKHF
jgi:MFS family permease